MIARCPQCKRSLGTHTPDLFGKPSKCIECETKDRVTMILSILPSADDVAFDRLSEWEQSFLESVRKQFGKKGAVTDKQYQILERIWEKH